MSPNILSLDNKPCASIMFVYYKNEAIVLHDPKFQTLNISMTPVTKDSLVTVINHTPNYSKPTIIDTIYSEINDPVDAAFAYSGLLNISRQYNIKSIINKRSFDISKIHCPIIDHILNGNPARQYKTMCFCVEIRDLDEVTWNMLRNNNIIINKNKITINSETEVCYNGLRFNEISSTLMLLIYEYQLGIRF
jgi:hypothetical protein